MGVVTILWTIYSIQTSSTESFYTRVTFITEQDTVKSSKSSFLFVSF